VRPSDPRIRAQLTPARGPLAGVVAGSVVAAILVIAQAFALAAFLVAALRGDHVVAWGVVVAGVITGRALAGLVVDLCAARAAATVTGHLRRRVLESVLSAANPGRSSGEIAALVTRGVQAAEPYLTRYVPALILAGILPFLTVAAIATQDVMSAVIVLSTLPLLPVFGALIGLATRDRAEEQWRAMASLSGHFVDVMKGLPTLVAFRRARAQSATIRAVTERYRVQTMRTLRIAFASSAVLELVATLSVALVAVVVGVRLAAGGLDLRTALVVLLLAPEAYAPIRRAGSEFHAAAEGVAAFEQVAGMSVARDDRPAPVGGPLVLSDLSVTYPGRSTSALAGIWATIPSRGLTAVVGPSGSGKSTLLAALAGLVPFSGTARVNGVDAGGDAWRAQIAWVPQRPAFLAGSVADNLRLAAPDATDEQLWSALRRVAIDDRVEQMPAGLDEPLGEDARTLSAGERARLALARVVLADPPWVLLDEPTAHVDRVTEQVIADVLLDLARASGVIVVAHRESMVRLADQVVVVNAQDDQPSSFTSADRVVVPVLHPQPVPPAPRRGFALSTSLSALASASGVALTATAGWLIFKAAEHPAILTMLVAIVGVRAFGLGRPVLRYAERLVGHDAALRLLAQRRVQVYDAVVPLTPGALGKRRGDALASIVDDVESVLDRQLRVRQPVRAAALVSLLASAVAGLLLPLAGFVVAVMCVLAGVAAYGIAVVATRQPEVDSVRLRADLSAATVEAAQMAPELVMWQAQDRTAVRLLATGQAIAECGRRAQRGLALARATALVVCATGVVLTGVVGSAAVADGRLSGPMMAMLSLLPLALADVLVPLSEAGGLSRRTRAAEARLVALESLRPLVQDPPQPRRLPAGRGISVSDLRVAWGDQPALEGASVDLPAGRRLGVVGPSGCGKSTLAAALLRFVDPTSGDVTLGDVALDRLALDDVRRTVGLVDDDPHVFATTVAENVRLARPHADDQAVEEALRQAQLGDWLDGLPEGLATWVGDGHAEISGGERARLALARSILADTPVLVLDEPTANLDTATAERVAADLLDAAAGRSIVWITHGHVGLDRMDVVLDLGA
jgi:ATP-binding cassette, subfamily C, bacterial CydCD